MQIGKTISVGAMETIETFPFDYFEVNIRDLIACPKNQADEFVKRIQATGKPIYSACCLFNWSDGFFERDDAFFRDWLSRAFAKMGELGVERVVFGSGGARRYDAAKMSYWRGLNRSYEILRLAEEYANRSGVIIGWEALNRAETNVGNTLVESAWIMRNAGISSIHGVTADLYHMHAVGDAPSDIAKAGNVVHAHFAAPQSRDYICRTDAFDYRPFFAAVRAAGLDHATMEGGGGELDADDIAFMHEVSAE